MKKGQLQIQESIFVVFIFFIIIMLSMIVFYQFENRNINLIREEHDENLFYNLFSYVPSMPELQCSSLGISDECIDLTKAKAFAFIDNQDYRDIFGYKKISLVMDEEVVLYEWNPNDFVTSRIRTSPVSVYDVRSDKYLVGVLEVVMYGE